MVGWLDGWGEWSAVRLVGLANWGSVRPVGFTDSVSFFGNRRHVSSCSFVGIGVQNLAFEWFESVESRITECHNHLHSTSFCLSCFLKLLSILRCSRIHRTSASAALPPRRYRLVGWAASAWSRQACSRAMRRRGAMGRRLAAFGWWGSGVFGAREKCF